MASTLSSSVGGSNSVTNQTSYTSAVGKVNKDTLLNLAEYQKKYQESQKVNDAYNKLQETMNNAPGKFSSNYQGQLDELYNKIMNRDSFNYNMNEDALYQQYKQQYQQQGKTAMNDTIASAAALTGGYANSYAQTAGQQQYQQYMQSLNDKVPELYEMAYNKYKDEGEALQNQYGLASDSYNREYGQYRDEVADYQSNRDFYNNQYQSERDFDYSDYQNNRNYWTDQYWNQKNSVQKTSSTAATTSTNWSTSTSLSESAKSAVTSGATNKEIANEARSLSNTDEKNIIKTLATKMDQNKKSAEDWLYKLYESGKITLGDYDFLWRNYVDKTKDYSSTSTLTGNKGTYTTSTGNKSEEKK